jgi:hypothetical protein
MRGEWKGREGRREGDRVWLCIPGWPQVQAIAPDGLKPPASAFQVLRLQVYTSCLGFIKEFTS